MKKTRGSRRVIVLACCLAAAFQMSCDAQEIDIAFSNGVWTHQAEANQHALRLQEDLREVGRIDVSNTAHLLYHTDSTFGNIAEVLIQKEIESQGDPAKTQRWSDAYFNILAGSATLDSPEVVALVGTADSPTDELFRAMKAKDRMRHQVGADIRKLEAALGPQHVVLLVSHSQGNLYSNASVLGVRQLPGLPGASLANLRIVGVGVPSNYLVLSDGSANYDDYVTNDGDRVIGLLGGVVTAAKVVGGRNPLLPPLQPNISIDTSGTGNGVTTWQAYQGHGFETIYLNRTLSGNGTFIDLVRCVLSAPRAACDVVASAGHSPDTFKKAPVPAEVAKYQAGQEKKQYKSSLTEPDKDAPSYPKEAIYDLAKQFELQGSQMNDFQRYADATWAFWESARGRSEYDDNIFKANLRALEAQICLDYSIAKSGGGSVQKRYLAKVQSTLASTPRAFKDYLHADSLADGQPITVATDRATACDPEKYISTQRRTVSS